MTPKAASEIGQSALLLLTGRPEALGRLLAESGLAPAELRGRLADPEFLGFVLDFVRSDEELAEAFCAAENLSPERLAAARAALPGGDAPFWL